MAGKGVTAPRAKSASERATALGQLRAKIQQRLGGRGESAPGRVSTSALSSRTHTI